MTFRHDLHNGFGSFEIQAKPSSYSHHFTQKASAALSVHKRKDKNEYVIVLKQISLL